VTTSGQELPGTWASHDPCPNYVEGPRVADDSVLVGASDDDGIDPPQAATMLRILLGELHSRRISARVSCPPADLDVRGLPAWSPTVEENSGSVGEKTREMAPEVWFVDRRVHTVTTTGVPYTDVDWLHPDGTWSRDREGARTFENTPNSMREVGEFIGRLREELHEELRHPDDINGVLMSPDRDWPFPLPPDTIRDHGHAWRGTGQWRGPGGSGQ
jgi:hypothetical protein